MLDDLSQSNTSVLYITIPSDASGLYNYTVTATGYNTLGQEWGFPTSFNLFIIATDVQVPEFPSIALPVAAVLGLVFVIGRKKEI